MIQYVWIYLLAGSLLGVLFRGVQARRLVATPEVFRCEILPYLMWIGVGMAFPWATMGLLLVVGLVPDAGLFATLGQRNLFVSIWKWLFFLETVGLVCWVSFGPGARFLARYPFLINAPKADERVIRVMAVLIWVAVYLVLFGNLILRKV
jgi:hypothetical protein